MSEQKEHAFEPASEETKEKIIFSEKDVNIPGSVSRFTISTNVIEYTGGPGGKAEFILRTEGEGRETYAMIGYDAEIVGIQLAVADMNERTVKDMGLRFPRASAIALLEATLAELKRATN
jgi:hypothetical protein